MYFITTKRMLEVCFSVHPNIQYRTFLFLWMKSLSPSPSFQWNLYPVRHYHSVRQGQERRRIHYEKTDKGRLNGIGIHVPSVNDCHRDKGIYLALTAAVTAYKK